MFLIFRTVRWKTISSFNQGDSCIWSDVHAAFSSVLDWYERKGQHVDNILWNELCNEKSLVVQGSIGDLNTAHLCGGSVFLRM